MSGRMSISYIYGRMSEVVEESLQHLNLFVEQLKQFLQLEQLKWRLRTTSRDFGMEHKSNRYRQTIGIQPMCLMSTSCGPGL